MRTLSLYGDGGDSLTKETCAANEIVSDGRFVGIVGHTLSSTSLATAPIYAAAGIPAITQSAAADSLTDGNHWYFRTILNNQQQGRQMALYSHFVGTYDNAVVVSSDDDYGTTLSAGFADAFAEFGTVKAKIVVSADSAVQPADLRRAAE